MHFLSLVPFLLLAAPSLVDSASPTTSSPAPQSTACGTIIQQADQGVYIFNASLIYECLTSVPFNPAVATRFLDYYNDTLQFQSTLTYLKNPPSSYQQPGVDLLEGLRVLQQAVDDGTFSNEYDFEAALQTLLYAAHDGHIDLYAGVLAAFTFGSPWDIISVSIDGVQPPKVYLAEDLVDSSTFTTFTPSAIVSINGIEITSYLTTFAAKNSWGTLEPHTDWNQLFVSPAQDIQGIFEVFGGGATFYPGDTVTFEFENGTSFSDYFIGIYNSPGPTGPLETGGDFYNFFVLGFYPAGFDPDAVNDTTTSSTPTPTPTPTSTPTPSPQAAGWDNPAYPTPDVVQPYLGTDGGGYLSGYFLNSSTAVLSIPSFDEYGDALNTFDATVADFITKAQAASLQRVVIDLQSNFGGQTLLAISAFKHFFPNINPFDGSRMRAHHAGYVMGNTITSYFNNLSTSDEDYPYLVANEWVATDLLNAEVNPNRNFSSWSEFFGPHAYDGDDFTTTQRYNLSSSVFDDSATDDEGGNFTVFEFSQTTTTIPSPPYKAQDIILLSDGICHSACALFMEMMHHEAGVRVVVVGGRPTTGPMQAPSGARGARSYDTYTLDANIGFTQEILNSTDPPSPDVNFLPNRTEAIDVLVSYASINLRDQIRRGEHVPLQFAYEAADCRIWFTPQTVYNYSALWQYAADAIWSKPSLCVAGSTGFAITGTNETDFVGPPPSISASAGSLNITLPPQNSLKSSSISYLTDLNDGLQDALRVRQNVICTTDADCGASRSCISVSGCSSKVCADTCIGTSICSNGGSCRLNSKVNGATVGIKQLSSGVCIPPPSPSCSVSTKNTGGINVGPPPPSKRDSQR